MNKKKHTRPKLEYEERLILEERYGNDLICGYARNFYRSGNYIMARCSLNGLSKCKRPMPMQGDNCGVYLDWLTQRREARDGDMS